MFNLLFVITPISPDLSSITIIKWVEVRKLSLLSISTLYRRNSQFLHIWKVTSLTSVRAFRALNVAKFQQSTLNKHLTSLPNNTFLLRQFFFILRKFRSWFRVFFSCCMNTIRYLKKCEKILRGCKYISY